MPHKLPSRYDEEDHNLTDTNGAAGAMDEDGQLDDSNDDGQLATDDSPLVQSLAVKFVHARGSEEGHTDIVAMIHTAQGISSKRTVISGGITAKRLGSLLAGVASW